MGRKLILKDCDFTENAINVTKLDVYIDALNLTNTAAGNGAIFGEVCQNIYNARMYSDMFYLAQNESVTIGGVSGLSIDYCYYTKPVYNNAMCVGSFSSQDSAKMFTFFDGSSDSVTLVNEYGDNYYFALVFRNTSDTTQTLHSDDYNITIRR